jgi:hypothetical protein
MKLQNIITAGFVIALSLICQSAFAQDATPATTHENGEQMQPSHFVPWPPIMERDITKKRRLWEDISLNDENNNYFALTNSRKPLLKILAEGVIEGKIKAYSAKDDRFTHLLTKEEFMEVFTKCKHTPGSDVAKYAIKEDSLFINTGEKTVRIVGLAPVVPTTMSDGSVQDQPIFWVYYPDCRSYLSLQQVDNDVTWVDVFERQQFKGVITRSTSSPWGTTIFGKSK